MWFIAYYAVCRIVGFIALWVCRMCYGVCRLWGLSHFSMVIVSVAGYTHMYSHARLTRLHAVSNISMLSRTELA